MIVPVGPIRDTVFVLGLYVLLATALSCSEEITICSVIRMLLMSLHNVTTVVRNSRPIQSSCAVWYDDE